MVTALQVENSVAGAWRSTWTGDARCAMGATTGKDCGFDDGVWCGYGAATYSMTGGDSGGPVFYPYGTVLAAGLTTGACMQPGIRISREEHLHPHLQCREGRQCDAAVYSHHRLTSTPA